MIKKILAIILSLSFILFSFTTVSLAYNDNAFKNLGLMPEKLVISDNAFITRAEFSYIVASIINNEEIEPANTRFTDVDVENEYSGYIEFLADLGVVSGNGNGEFNPNGNVTADAANKMFVSAIGYGDIAEKRGGYPEGYRSIAGVLNINRNVSVAPNAVLSTKDVCRMLENFLEAKTPDSVYIGNDVIYDFNSGSESVLGKNLKISVYEGLITGFETEKGIAELVVSENYYENNPVMVSSGDTLYLHCSEADADYFESVPAIVWVNSEEEILHIESKSNVSVEYKIIDSVNGDSDNLSKYSINNIDEISFYDDKKEYNVKAGAKLKYNNAYTSASVKLAGKVAKVVKENKDIIFIESWDLEHGGLITEITPEKIVYQSGVRSLVEIEDIHLFDNIKVILNGEVVSYNSVKADSVFDFYKSDESIVLIVSEKMIADEFVGTSDDSIFLGDIEYIVSDIYWSKDGVKYKADDDFKSLFNILVCAHMSPNGQSVYLKPYDESMVKEREFYGLVCDVAQRTERTGLEDDIKEIEIINLDDKAFKKERFTLTEKTLFNDYPITETDLSELKNNSSNYDGKGLYMFVVGENGKVKSISAPKRLKGYEGSATPSSFADSTAQVQIDGKYLYFSNKPIIGIYNNKGEFSAKSISWSDIQGSPNNKNNDGNGTLSFYSRDGGIEISLVLMTGNLEMVGGNKAQFGVLTSKRWIIDENGDEMCQITIVGKGGAEKYIVTKELADTLTLMTYMQFYPKLDFSQNSILVGASYDISKEVDNWVTVESDATDGPRFGYVEEVCEDLISFEDGNVYPIYSSVVYLEYDTDDGGEPVRKISQSGVKPGDYVYYDYRKSSGIRCILVVE